MHRRRIELDKKARRLLVEDTLEMEDEHEVELAFHCSERCRVDAVEGGYVLEQEGTMVRIILPGLPQAQHLVYRGSLSPMAGWVSRSLDHREPAPTIVWKARLAGNTLLRTEILVARRAD